MSVNTIPVGRYRTPPLAVVVALVAAIVLAVLAVLAVANATQNDDFSHEAPAPAADVPLPDWLQRYMDYEAPADEVPVPHYEAPTRGSAGPL